MKKEIRYIYIEIKSKKVLMKEGWILGGLNLQKVGTSFAILQNLLWNDLCYDHVWNLSYILVHGDDKTILGSMTTYNPPLFGLKKLCDS